MITYQFSLEKIKKLKKQNCLNETLAQVHMLIHSGTLNHKLSIYAKLWEIKSGRQAPEQSKCS